MGLWFGFATVDSGVGTGWQDGFLSRGHEQHHHGVGGDVVTASRHDGSLTFFVLLSPLPFFSFLFIFLFFHSFLAFPFGFGVLLSAGFFFFFNIYIYIYILRLSWALKTPGLGWLG